MPTIRVNSSYEVTAGQRLAFVNEDAFSLEQQSGAPALALTVGGVVEVSGDRSAPSRLHGISVGLSGQNGSTEDTYALIQGSGVLRVTSTSSGGAVFGFATYGGLYDPDLINRGLIEVTAAGGAATGARNGSNTWLFENSGTLRVTSTGRDATGVFQTNGGTVRNSGIIEVEGQTASFGVRVLNYPASFSNSGVIRVRDHTTDVDSVAVLWNLALDPQPPWTNSGWIEGDYALKVTGLPEFSVAAQQFVNQGTLAGLVVLNSNASTLVNSGYVRGDVQMGYGADVYDGGSGHLFGRLSGGDGADTLTGGVEDERLAGDAGADSIAGGGGADTIEGGSGANYLRGDDGSDSIVGGAAFDDINGNMGDDTAAGGDGVDWVVGGKDNDRLSGDGGDDIVYGNLGNDTCDGGAGADLIRGGQGDDTLSGGAGNDWLSGDRGDDTIAGGTGADIFHGSQDAGLDRVTDFSSAEGDRVQLDPGTTYTLRQEGADTIVDMGGANRMVLVGVTLASLPAGWIFGA